MQLLIDLRKEAKTKKDFVTSDKIRNQLVNLGIEMKDEKDGDSNWEITKFDQKREFKISEISALSSEMKDNLTRMFPFENENFYDIQVIKIFKTENQETNLLINNTRLICNLSNLKYKTSRFKWFMTKDEIFDENGSLKIKIKARETDSEKLGLIDFGKNHKDWYYSKDIFKTPEQIESEIITTLKVKMNY